MVSSEMTPLLCDAICASSWSFFTLVLVQVWTIVSSLIEMSHNRQMQRMKLPKPVLNSVSCSPAFCSIKEYKNCSATPELFPKFCGSGSIPMPCSKMHFLVISSSFSLASTGNSIVKVETPEWSPSPSLSICIAL